MTPRVVFRPQAQAEIEAARAWYEQQAPGLGTRFASALEAALGCILERPLAYPCVSGDIRRALLKQFPHGVFYRPREGEIVVIAVIHGRRHPGRWRSRR